MDALIHTADGRCEPAIPLVQPEPIDALSPPGVLTMACPAGCGVALVVPIAIGDQLSLTVEDGEPRVRFTAEAPELRVILGGHLRTCPSAHLWVGAALAPTPTTG
jgi:hypothetical protein